MRLIDTSSTFLFAYEKQKKAKEKIRLIGFFSLRGCSFFHFFFIPGIGDLTLTEGKQVSLNNTEFDYESLGKTADDKSYQGNVAVIFGIHCFPMDIAEGKKKL